MQVGTIAPITSLQFCFNGLFHQIILSTRSNNQALTDAENLTSALGAGVLTSFLIGPVDLITIQQQKLRASPFRTLHHLVGNHGFLSLFRGIGPTMVREAMYTSGYLGLSPVITHHLMQKNATNYEYKYPMFGNSPLLSRIAGASIAGTLAAIITNPADCLKTCVQSDMSGELYPNARRTLYKIYRGELDGGPNRLWTGLGPRIVRFNVAFFIFLSFQELAIADWSTASTESKCELPELRVARPGPV